ncbi:MAG: DUF2878 domain-containing protein [Lysobacterales bacterium]
MHKLTQHKIINAVLFQLAWFGFVAGAARNMAWLGLVPLVLLAGHALRDGSTRKADLALAAAALAIGLVLDGSFARAHLLVYADAEPALVGAPWWILAMWLAFAWTLNHSLAYLQKHLGVAIALGVIAGPFSYYVADRAWGALEFIGDARLTLVWLALTWGIATGVLVLLARRLHRPHIATPALV